MEKNQYIDRDDSFTVSSLHSQTEDLTRFACGIYIDIHQHHTGGKFVRAHKVQSCSRHQAQCIQC